MAAAQPEEREVSEPIEDRVAKLPTWAREYIAGLLKQIKNAEPERQELRRKITHRELINRQLRDRLDAIEELLKCAARGGHETAKAYVDRIINEYDSTTPED